MSLEVQRFLISSIDVRTFLQLNEHTFSVLNKQVTTKNKQAQVHMGLVIKRFD